MTIAVKICGLTSAKAADAAASAGAMYGGLVFHRASPRNVEIGQASKLAEQMRGRLKFVALVADANDMDLTVITAQVKPDYLQLHGAETAARVAAIRTRFNIPVIKALPVAEASDFAGVAEYEAVADMLLFDAKPPRNADRGGGHGAAFDWQLLAGRNFARPWFLAGGLDSENVARAIALSGATAVDVSSGVESAPGVKDPARIAQFIAATQQVPA